jgi:ABC-type multidrug transport system fused ATPase/permease subunit
MYFSHLGKQLNNDLIHAERLLGLLEKKPTVRNKPTARPFKYKEGMVEFDKVCFTYDDKKDITKDLSFTVQGGQSVAFVGATGAGKTTILKLLSRLYDVTGGSIRIDGQDIRDVDLERYDIVLSTMMLDGI